MGTFRWEKCKQTCRTGSGRTLASRTKAGLSVRMSVRRTCVFGTIPFFHISPTAEDEAEEEGEEEAEVCSLFWFAGAFFPLW